MPMGPTLGRTIWPRRRTYSAVGPVAAAKTPYLFALLALVLIPELGVRSYGSARWIRIGPLFQLQPSELIKRHCFTAVESMEPVEQMVEVYGADNFFIGTDFPHPEFQFLPNYTTHITERRLAEEDKAKILGGNLAGVLNISPVVEESPVPAGV